MGDRFDGGPAYPVNELNRTTGDICDKHMGLTVRDHFATAALQGQIAAFRDPNAASAVVTNANRRGVSPKEQVALAAYEYADAMLKARQSNG